MATLALNAVGTALGGPIGGALGSLIGQGIDRSLFGPGPRQGPRLDDLRVQTSSYGTQVPRVYGTMRVGGTIVWATELQEASELVGDAVIYTYSVSFAVALSSRNARSVGRIWADGKLLRGAAGDFKVKTGFRFYSGDEDQAVDPVIASIEGPDSAPAYRGVALAVFEDLQLNEFGNRIPTMTFELFGDDGEPSLAAIVNDVGGGAIACNVTDTVGGYAAYGANRRNAIAPLVEQFAILLFDNGDRLVTPSSSLPVEVEADEIGCNRGDEVALLREWSQVPAGEMPRSLTLSYYDPLRDYQTGQMRAAAGPVGGLDEGIELPVVLSAERAKALAETNMARRWAERDKRVLRLPTDRLAIEPGDFVRLGDGSAWRVDSAVFEEFALRVQLTRQSGAVASTPADAGRFLPAPDLVASPTIWVVLDLPDLGIGRHDVPTLQVAACQVGATWRQVPIEVTSGGEVRTISSATAEAVIGTVLTTLGDGTNVEVELVDPDHWLESRDDVALSNGANLAALGSELIQFGSAVPIGQNRFSLGNLRRGCRGTEWAMGSHAPGEVFVLIEPGVLQETVFPPTAIGSTVSFKARGLADDRAEPVERIVTGEAMRPPSPVDLSAQPTGDGGLSLAWVRRSRLGWTWPAGTEAPPGESAEKYRVGVQGSAGTLTFEAFEPQIIISAQAIAGMAGTVTITVVQVGDFADSRPASVSVLLGG